MPKQRTTSTLTHTNDATFRAWVQICEDLLDASGLVRTADTGQIVVASVLRPAVNTAAGYSMWRFDDPLQSIAPVFVKFEYGTAGQTNAGGMWMTVGRGSDGAGGITGELFSRGAASNAGSDLTLLKEFMATHNQWGAALIAGAYNGPTGSFGAGFVIQRTCDSSGSPTADGLMVNIQSTPGATNLGRAGFAQFYPILTIRTPAADTLALLPMGLTDYMVGTSPQVFPVWVALPKVRPMNFLTVGPLAGSPGIGQTFQMAVVGTQARTYICIGPVIGRHYYPSVAATAYIMWED